MTASAPHAQESAGTAPAPAASPVGSVDKALVLLGILAEAGPEGMSLRDVAEESGLNKASVHRLLRALMHRGFAEQSASDQHYRLGAAALDLGPAFGAGENLQTLFGPALASISQHTHELVHLGQMDGVRVLYLDKVEPERTLRVWSRIGSRARPWPRTRRRPRRTGPALRSPRRIWPTWSSRPRRAAGPRRSRRTRRASPAWARP